MTEQKPETLHREVDDNTKEQDQEMDDQPVQKVHGDIDDHTEEELHQEVDSTSEGPLQDETDTPEPEPRPVVEKHEVLKTIWDAIKSPDEEECENEGEKDVKAGLIRLTDLLDKITTDSVARADNPDDPPEVRARNLKFALQSAATQLKVYEALDRHHHRGRPTTVSRQFSIKTV